MNTSILKQEGKLSMATEHGADDTVFWDSKLSEQELIELTKSKAVGGEINAIIDFVNSTESTARSLQYLTKVNLWLSINYKEETVYVTVTATMRIELEIRFVILQSHNTHGR